jgi:hypothetical protein
VFEAAEGTFKSAVAGGSMVDIAKILGGVSKATATGGVLSTALVKGQMHAIRKGIGSKFPGVIEALDAKRGAVMNPHKALVYQGPGGFRTFSFTYKFSPASIDEAKAAADIVYFFKYHMHPSMDANEPAVGQGARQSGRQAAMFKSINLKYPDEFLLEIIPRSKPQKRELGKPTDNTQKNPLFRIDRCFLETCTVDYSTDGVPAFFQQDPNDGDQAYPVISILLKKCWNTICAIINSTGFKETPVYSEQWIFLRIICWFTQLPFLWFRSWYNFKKKFIRIF